MLIVLSCRHYPSSARRQGLTLFLIPLHPIKLLNVAAESSTILHAGAVGPRPVAGLSNIDRLANVRRPVADSGDGQSCGLCMTWIEALLAVAGTWPWEAGVAGYFVQYTAT